ncbi:MAG TPA: hypothetical protein VLZ75_14990 [Chitinophagales bacterium]|nr:hypothetical protein [Chitinophagales bacterium]
MRYFSVFFKWIKRRGLKAVIFFIGVLFLLLNIYIVVYSNIILSVISKGKTLYSTGIYKSDIVFGLKGKANSNGFIFFPGGDSIPVSLNNKGERVGFQSKGEESYKSKILFIGDSFTFGDANYFEESFPYLISKGLEMQLINASMVGYGYSQYLIKIKNEILNEKINTIAIQVSPYSAERSINGFLPAFSKIPTPFFCLNQNDSIIIHPALYESNLFKIINHVGISQFSDKVNSPKLFWEFYSKVGFPIYSNQIKSELRVLLKKKDYKRVLTEQEAEKHFFLSLNNLLVSKNYNIVFYNVGYRPDDFEVKVKKIKSLIHFEATFINLEKSLWDLVTDQEHYDKRFCHWRGNPPILVDKHYNKEGHSIVSNMFVQDFVLEQQLK